MVVHIGAKTKKNSIIIINCQANAFSLVIGSCLRMLLRGTLSSWFNKTGFNISLVSEIVKISKCGSFNKFPIESNLKLLMFLAFKALVPKTPILKHAAIQELTGYKWFSIVVGLIETWACEVDLKDNAEIVRKDLSATVLTQKIRAIRGRFPLTHRPYA